jgi:hypothetical protein
MAVQTRSRTTPHPPQPHVPAFRRRRRGWWVLLVLVVAVAVAAIVTTIDPAPVAAPLTPEVVPPSIGDAIPGQRIVFLASFTDDGATSDAAVVTAATTDEFAPDVAITVVPDTIRSGEVAEVTVVIGDAVVADLPDTEPMLGQGGPLRPADDPTREPVEAETPISPLGPEGVTVPIAVTMTRGSTVETRDLTINVSPGEDLLVDEAIAYRDRFVTWLEAERPELGITSATVWEPTIVQPHILVVTHYLFFSEEWEMSVMWHVMIAPYDWSRISLRPRAELSPALAFEIPSISDPAGTVVEIAPPAYVDR